MEESCARTKQSQFIFGGTTEMMKIIGPGLEA